MKLKLSGSHKILFITHTTHPTWAYASTLIGTQGDRTAPTGALPVVLIGGKTNTGIAH